MQREVFDSVIPDAVFYLLKQCANTSGVSQLQWETAAGVNASALPTEATAITNKQCRLRHGELVGADCQRRDYVGDVFFFSCLVFAGTFCFSYGFKLLRNTSFFTGLVRAPSLRFDRYSQCTCTRNHSTCFMERERRE